MCYQLHAELMSLIVRMSARRQAEAAPLVWEKMLLLQLGVQAAGERHLVVYAELASLNNGVDNFAKPEKKIQLYCKCWLTYINLFFTKVRTLVVGGKILKLRQACRSTGSRR